MDQLTVSPSVGETNGTGFECKKSIVTTATNIGAGVNPCPALPNNDSTGGNRLPTENLYSQHLRVGISSVLGRTNAFFVCHDSGYQSDVIETICTWVYLWR